MAYGSTLKKGSTVITSRDSSRSARMLKRAMMAGLNAVGVNVVDLEVASVPGHPLHHAAPGRRAAGSRSASSNDDPQSVIIRFFDANGLDITEDDPAQDRAAVRPRGLPAGVPRRDRRHRLPAPGPRALRRRARGAPSTSAAIRAAAFKVVIDYAYGSTSFVMPNVLAKLGARGAGREPVRVHRRGHARPTSTSTPRQVGDLVRTSGAHLGAVIDPDGERLTLIDDEGHVLTDTEALLAVPVACSRATSTATASPCR